MKRIFFVASRRVDHERWNGTSGDGSPTVVRLESDVQLVPGAIRYDMATDGKTPWMIVGAEKLPWSDAVRLALFPGSSSGATYETLCKDPSIPFSVRTAARDWLDFGASKGDPLLLALDDVVGVTETFVAVGGDESHVAVGVALWNAAIRDAVKCNKVVWVSNDMLRNMSSLDPIAFQLLLGAGKVIVRNEKIAFSWAVEQDIAPIMRYDDCTEPPSGDLTREAGDRSAIVDRFVDAKRVCHTMMAGPWIPRKPHLMQHEIIEIPLNGVSGWISKNVSGPRQLLLDPRRPVVLSICNNRAIEVRCSPNKKTLFLDGTREVDIAWAMQNIRTICVRSYEDAFRKIPIDVRFDRVICVDDGATRKDYIRECIKWGPVVVLKLKK